MKSQVCKEIDAEDAYLLIEREGIQNEGYWMSVNGNEFEEEEL